MSTLPANGCGDPDFRRRRYLAVAVLRAVGGRDLVFWDGQLGRWVSDAEVAETRYTAFTSRKGQAITARLIVRRVLP